MGVVVVGGGTLFDFFSFSNQTLLLTERTFPPISGGVSGATAPDRGDPLSPTTTLGGMAYVHTHILYILAWLQMYTHTHADSNYAHAHTLHCYTISTVLKHGMQK